MSLNDAGAIISAHSGGTVAASRPRARVNCALYLLRKAPIPVLAQRGCSAALSGMSAQGSENRTSLDRPAPSPRMTRSGLRRDPQVGRRPEPTLNAIGRFSPLADLYTLAQRSNAARIRSCVA